MIEKKGGNARNWLCRCLLMTTIIFASCGDANTSYVKHAIRLMDRNGLYAEGEEWEAVKREALSTKPATIEEAQAAVRKALTVAGGKHSFLLTSDEATADDTATWAMPTVEVQNGIAIVTIPRFSGNYEEGHRYAQTVLDALPTTLDGAVIDLRDNTGGNMYPMIAAVHRFLPDDILVRIRTRKQTTPINKDYILNTVGTERQAAIDCPVALLTNERTGSSGEFTLLCFRGLRKARTFGAPTAGYASTNASYPMPDGSCLVLTVGTDVARTGEEFCDTPIVPDHATDTPLEDALSWLRAQ